MAKHSKRSASIFRYPVLLAFSLFFVGLFALDLITPDRAYSELENTTLSQRPSQIGRGTRLNSSHRSQSRMPSSA